MLCYWGQPTERSNMVHLSRIGLVSLMFALLQIAFCSAFLQSWRQRRAITGPLFLSSSTASPGAINSTSIVDTDDWHERAEQIRNLFVDPYYRNIPIRPSTVKKASEYFSLSNDDLTTTCGIFPGKHAYLGGAMDDRDGCIYGIPSHARSIVCLYPSSRDDGYRVLTLPLPSSIANGKFKWLRGILADGYLYGIPAWADCVLQVNIDALWGRREVSGNEDIVKLLPLPAGYDANGQTWQWHGAALNSNNTAIYCIPSNAKQVLKVDLLSFTTHLIDIDIPDEHIDFSLDLTNKWYGGIIGDDNAIYGIPYRSGSILRIDADTDTATLVGPDYGANKWNWHGGIKANGSIYAFPSHADSVLKIDTSPTSRGRHVHLLPIPRQEEDVVQNYKWLGGSIGMDGNIYGMPCDASSILKINVDKNECTTFGDTGVGKSKWQGAVLARDGHVYAIPSYGRHVLQINTNPTSNENDYQLLGEIPLGKSKYQGGFVGTDGCIYCVPENGYHVLQVTPMETTGGGDSEAKVEMM